LNSAGAAGNFLAPISQLSTNAFKSVMDIDVLGSYNTMKATMPELLKSASRNAVTRRSETPNGTGGRIIFVSATIHYTGSPLQTHVAAAKAAVDQVSAAVAIEYGPRGVYSNIIAPGPIGGTEGVDRLVKQEDVKAGEKHVPAGRYGSVKDIADATVYLFSDTGNYVNGEILVVDGGGWHIPSTLPGGSFHYPESVLTETAITGVKGRKKSKL
jgi:2,4-dienoyl-CoA reductase [(3E)-enoyl-CoA-producing], peroxisomal